MDDDDALSDLPRETQMKIWRNVMDEQQWTVERAMEVADSTPEVDYILATDDALWRSWWRRDFELQERDLRLTARGLPNWILYTRPTGSEQVDERYARVPWRRMYVWSAFFQRRLAKYVIDLADKQARQVKLKQPNLPGVRIVAYYPTYELDRPDPSSMRVLPRVTMTTEIPGQGYDEYDESDLINLLYDTSGPYDLEPVWVAWHTINDREGVPNIQAAQEKLGFVPNTLDGDVPVVYNFPFLRAVEYGAIMLGYIIWYAHTARSLLTPIQFPASLGTASFADYREYVDYYTRNPPGARLDLPEVITQRSLDRLLPSTIVALDNLPHAPLRRPAYTAKDSPTKAVLFVGDPINSRACVGCGVAEAIQQCSRCKTAAYCGKECQKEHWVDGGHREVCGSIKGEK